MGAEIDRLEVQIEAEAQSANSQLDLMIKKLNEVNKALSGIDLEKLHGVSENVKSAGKSAQDSANRTKGYSNAISALSRSVGASNLQIKKLTSTLGGYIAKSTLAKNRSKSLSQSFGMFYASFFPIIRGVKALGKAIESSMDYIETYNYFGVTMDKIGKEFSKEYQKFGYDSAESYSKSFTERLTSLTKKMTGYKIEDNGMLSLTSDKNLGLDPNQVMNYQASISAVTNSVGLCGETSVNTAKALSMLAADLSSFKNVDLKTVMTNMQSGLIGQSRAMYKYGIDITNATLQTYAYKYGLTTAVSEMTQADKMQLRLLAILDQSKIAWADQANTINSVANQWRIFKQQVQNVSRALGSLFIPIAQAVLPVVNGITIAISRLLNFIGPLIYGTERWNKIMDGISSGYSGMDTGDIGEDMEDFTDSAGNAADNLGKAKKNAKDLKNAMLGIDELNVIQPEDDSDTTGGKSGSGSGGAGGIDLSNEIGSLVSEYEAIWNEAFEKSVNQAESYANKITKVFSNMWKLLKSGDYEGLGEYVAGGVDLVFEKINSVFNWQKMGPTIQGFVDGYTRTMNSLVTNVDWQNIGKTIGDGLNVVTNTMYLYLTGIDWVNLGIAFANGLNGMFNSVDWLMLGQTVGAWLMKIPKMVYGFVTTLNWDEVGQGIGTAINGVLMEIDGETLAGGINGLVNGILTTLKETIKTVDWSDVAKTIGDVLGNLDWGTAAGIGIALCAGKLALVFASKLKPALSAQITKVVAGVKEAFALAFVGAGTLKEAFIAEFGTAGWMISGIATTVAGLVTAVSNFVDMFKNGFSAMKEVVMLLGIALTAVGAIILGAPAVVAGVVAGIVAAVATLVIVVKNNWDKIVKFFKNAWESIEKVFAPVGKYFSEKFELGYQGIKNAFQFIGSWFQEKWNSVKKVFAPVKDYFGSAFKSAYGAIKDAFAGIGKFFSGIANNIIEPIGKAVNGVINGINWVLGKVGSKTQIGLWTVPKFATGTNGLPQNTLGMVNDQSGSTYKEMIVPPHGSPFIPKGRNVVLPMEKGTKIMPANQTKAFMDNIPKFEGGIGKFFGGMWDSFTSFTGNVLDYITHPAKIMRIAIDKFTDTAGWTGVVGDIATGAINKVFDSVVNFVKKIFDTTGGAGVEKAVKWALGIANDNSHGYDQGNRWGTPDYDCSSLVISAFEQAGIKLKSSGASYTGNMYAAAKNCGFSDVTGSVNLSNAAGMKRGDILLNRKNHTAMYIGDGKVVQASSNENGGILGGRPGDQTGREISVGSYYNYPWDDVLRYAKAYATGGLPNTGELFFARERGPELVGRMGNQNAVVNNEQIVESVSKGVESAVRNQNLETNYLLRRVIELEEELLKKETSVNVDGKRMDKQLARARKNTGFSFSPA